jgi:DNA-binding transcriptional MerR regulator
MAYTVKQVAAMSGVSVRTLHFYDEMGLLKPAYVGANAYRFYEEPQLLTLQQILFYRELGFELKQIKEVLGQADFEIAAALESHRSVLQNNLARTQELIETIRGWGHSTLVRDGIVGLAGGNAVKWQYWRGLAM